jgi:hypothetical protein
VNEDRSRPYLAPLESGGYSEPVQSVRQLALYERIYFGLPSYGRVLVVMAFLGGTGTGLTAGARLWSGFQPAAVAKEKDDKLSERIDNLRNDLTTHVQAERTIELSDAVKKAIVKAAADAVEEATPTKHKPKRRPPPTPPSDIDERP